MLRLALAITLGMGGAGLAPLAGGGDAIAQQAAQPSVPAAKTARLIDVLRLSELVDIVSLEGIAGAPQIEMDMFAGRGGAGWQRDVARIYDASRLDGLLMSAVPGPLSEADHDTLIAFFSSDLGTRLTRAEIETRRAMLDEATEEAMREQAMEMRASDHPRIALVEDFIEAYDLVSSNVVGGLNSNFAFYQGLEAGGALPRAMTETEMLQEVWSQQDDIREETEAWLFSYLLASYDGFSDDELRTYTAFARTDAARAFNTMVFDGFDVMFETVSRDLGRAVATYLSGQDI